MPAPALYHSHYGTSDRGKEKSHRPAEGSHPSKRCLKSRTSFRRSQTYGYENPTFQVALSQLIERSIFPEKKVITMSSPEHHDLFTKALRSL
jgi:hypothetical protein